MHGPPTIANHVTTRTPISHDITLGRYIGRATTILSRATSLRAPSFGSVRTFVEGLRT